MVSFKQVKILIYISCDVDVYFGMKIDAKFTVFVCWFWGQTSISFVDNLLLILGQLIFVN